MIVVQMKWRWQYVGNKVEVDVIVKIIEIAVEVITTAMVIVALAMEVKIIGGNR